MTFLTFVSILLTTTTLSRDFRLEEFERVKNYELIYINTESLLNSQQISFNAFGNEYKINLQKNNLFIPSNIKSTHIPKPEISHHKHFGYYHKQTESCHYNGNVINSKSSHMSLEICNNRGIRGFIYAFNEILIIKPSNYFLNLTHDSYYFHDITDQHLVYKISDFDKTGLQMPHSVSNNDNKLDIKHISYNISEIKNGNFNKKRRMWSYNSQNYVELSFVADPAITDHYKRTYPSKYYDELYAYMVSHASGIAAKWALTDFQSPVGYVQVFLSEIEIQDGWYDTQRKLALYPVQSGGCNDYTVDGCKIDGLHLFAKFGDFIAKYKNPTTKTNLAGSYDNAILWTKWKFARAAGWGTLSSVCTGAGARSIVSDCNCYFDIIAGAHELGHNFGMSHDCQDGKNMECCGDNSGIMGPSGGENGFSYCSINLCRDYFYKNEGHPCLANYPTNDLVNSGSNNGGGGTTTCDQTCVKITNFNTDSDKIFTGEYSYYGCLNNKESYKSDNGYYIFWDTSYKAWYITPDESNKYWLAYCQSDSIISCTGKWYYYSWDQSSWVVNSNAVAAKSCTGSSGGGSTGNGGTCTGYTCKGFWSNNADNTEFRGEFRKAGCHNSKPYYINNYNNYYLYWQDNYWNFRKGEINGYGTVLCIGKENLEDCPGNVAYLKNNAWVYDNDVFTYTCSGSDQVSDGIPQDAPLELINSTNNTDSSFNSGETGNYQLNITDGDDCNTVYGDSLCINNMFFYKIFMGNLSTINNQVTQFTLEGCKNGIPFYEWKILNDSYYIHYYSDKWLISQNTIDTISGHAHCYSENLIKCSANSWLIKNFTNWNNGEIDSIEYMAVNEMHVDNECKLLIADNGVDMKNGLTTTQKTIIGVSIAVGVILIIIAGVVIFKCCKKNKSTDDGIGYSQMTAQQTNL